MANKYYDILKKRNIAPKENDDTNICKFYLIYKKGSDKFIVAVTNKSIYKNLLTKITFHAKGGKELLIFDSLEGIEVILLLTIKDLICSEKAGDEDYFKNKLTEYVKDNKHFIYCCPNMYNYEI